MSKTPRTTPRVQPKATPSGAVFRHVLVPTDFSNASLAAVAFARAWCAQLGAGITLLHVIQPINNPDMSAYALLIPDAKLKRDLRARLNKLAAEQDLGSSLVGVEVREGIPFDVITNVANELNVDGIVISTHGYTGLKRVMLGSTTERVVRHTKCPVLVIPAKQ